MVGKGGRGYGGWGDGNPSTLKPAPDRELAAELAALAGGAQALAGRAAALARDGRLRLAGHLAELAWLAAPDDRSVGQVKREVFTSLAQASTSTMASGVYRWAAGEALGGAS